jgi:WD40 repeat protein
MTVAPDGSWLAAGERGGYISIWDLNSRKPVYRFQQSTPGSVKCLAISPDGRLLATGCTDRLVHVFDLSRPWAHRPILVGQHYDRLQQVAISPDGEQVAGCDKNGAIRIWRLNGTGMEEGTDAPEPEMSWQAHRGRGYAVAFDPQQDRVATGGHESHVAIWDLDTRTVELDLGASGRLDHRGQSLVFCAASKRLIAAAADGVQIWDWASRTMQERLSQAGEPREHVTVSPDGSHLAAALDSQRVVEVWRKSSDQYQLLWEKHDQCCDHFAFSPDTRRLAIADWTDDEVVVYRTETGEIERRIPAEQCRCVAFSLDGRLMAFTEEDDVLVWDWAAQRVASRLRGHLSTATWVAFSPDGQTLASSGRDRRVNLWDVETGQLRHTMMGHRAYVRMAVFVGDDRLVSLGEDGTVMVWDAHHGLPLCWLREDPYNPCYYLAVSPDQRWLDMRLADGRIPRFDISRPYND